MDPNSKALEGEVIRATNCCNLQRNIVALQVEKHFWSYYHPPGKHCHATKFVVAKSRRQFNSMQHAASTCNNEISLLRDNVYQVGGNTNSWIYGWENMFISERLSRHALKDLLLLQIKTIKSNSTAQAKRIKVLEKKVRGFKPIYSFFMNSN